MILLAEMSLGVAVAGTPQEAAPHFTRIQMFITNSTADVGGGSTL